MARRRFFADRVVDGHAEIAGENAHHLARVLRVEAGQKYEITDSIHVWFAEVEEVHKSLVRFTLLYRIEDIPALAETTLYLALIKFDCFEWALEKATELGVTRVVPVDAARSDRGLFPAAAKRVERWRKIAREASEQSRRLSAPEVADAVKMQDAATAAGMLRIWLDEQPGAPPLAEVLGHVAAQPVTMIIGPEGGWAEDERERLITTGWQRSSLGPLILRAETAVCAALAVVAQSRILSPPIQSKETSPNSIHAS